MGHMLTLTQNHCKMQDFDQSLKERLADYRKTNPKAYLRSVASELGSNEASLIVFEEECVFLDLSKGLLSLLNEVKALGQLTAITRNDFAVSEFTSEIAAIEERGKVIIVHMSNAKIEMSATQVVLGLLVIKESRNSVQFYDKYGDSAVKFFIKDDQANITALSRAEYSHSSHGSFEDRIVRPFEISSEVKKQVGLVRALIERHADVEKEIRIVVANHAVVQSFTGQIHKVVDARGWFNILDADYNLHLKDEEIEEVYAKQTQDKVEISALSKQNRVLSLEIEKSLLTGENE